MDIFDSTYYKIIKNLHRLLGLWPYQKSIEKYILRFIIMSLDISLLIPQILNIISIRKNLNLLLDSLPVTIIHFIHITKYCTYILKNDKMRELFNMIRDDWSIAETKHSNVIVQRYATTGRKISLGYVIAYYIGLLMFFILTFTPRMLDILIPLNESRPFTYIFSTDYMVDPVEYYIPIIIHQIIGATITISSIIATDSTYSVYSHHACGMFAAVRHQLNNTLCHEKTSESITPDKYQISKQLIDCIENHKRAIWFVDTMESAYVGLMFVILLTGVLSLSVTGVQATLNMSHPPKAFRAGVLCFGHFVHIFYYSWNSQKILDHSSIIFEAAYDTEWYRVLDGTTKLMSFMMLRSTKPCVQTAGRVFPMTLMNFTVIVKTSMSYFTVLSNSQ